MKTMTVLVKVTVYFKDGSFTNKEILVKNAMSEVHAQVKLEKHLKKKYQNFRNMHVYEVREDFLSKFGFTRDGFLSGFNKQ